MSRSSGVGVTEPARESARPRTEPLLSDEDLAQIEAEHAAGLTSRQIVDLLSARGVRFSEATLRKYVQLGLAPRSVRVGRKGKHRGSCGVYPAGIVRRVNLVRGMMAQDLTIEQIRRSFARFKDEIDGIEAGLRELIGGFEREAREPRLSAERRRHLEEEIRAARETAGELIRRITGLEKSLTARNDVSGPGAAVGGGADLY